MKNRKFNYLKISVLLGLVLTLSLGCERDLSDDAVEATFPKIGEIFTDNFVGMGSNFYLPFLGSKLDAFSVDNQEGYESSASFRVDVPNADDPTGNYAGAILRVDGPGRDLSGYDALTFWAKASRGVSIDAIGFGQDFLENKYQVNANNFSIGTNWAKYTIPIPDASKLTEERGMFWYAAGTQDTGGSGYVLWFDDIKFEKLGTVAQPRPAMSNGEDLLVDSFNGVSLSVTGLSQTFNLASGLDMTVQPAPSYFVFSSSNTNVATVDMLGNISVVGPGTSVITSNLGGQQDPITNEITGGIDAAGSITINSLGDFDFAPTPTRDPSNVVSIFSDHYNNVPVDFFNGFWQPFQTTLSADFTVSGDNILNYTNFNFVGNQFANPTVNATDKPNLHLNMYIPGDVPANFDFLISVEDFGDDKVDGGGDDTRQQIFVRRSDVVANTWMTLEFPITLANRDNLGLIIYENINGSSLRNFYLDNIYFYGVPTGPTVAAPTPTLPVANVISLFSEAYTNVPVDTWRTSWSSANFADVLIAGNATKEYSNLDFVGIETTTNRLDITSMTHFHIDTWSSGYTSFSVKLVDFGANGVFGGGDDTEHQVNFPNPSQGGWVSWDIPLSSFTGLLNRQNIAQYILVAQPAGAAKVYVDNMYFHN